MGFDRRYYREIKKFMDWRLNNRPLFCEITDPFEYVKGFLPLLSDCVSKEDYEAAQAMKDAIREFLNRFCDGEITDEAMLRLPEIKPVQISK